MSTEAERWHFLCKEIGQDPENPNADLIVCLNRIAIRKAVGYHKFYYVFPDQSTLILGGEVLGQRRSA